MQPLSDSSQRYLLLQVLLGVSVLLNLSGLFVTILGPDGTLYATIAKTMVQRNNFIELFARDADWLDKPHVPFWITAVFFKVFGYTTWAYKLPGILVLLMGSRYTFLLAKQLYNKETGFWAAIILLTAQHTILSNNDVRAEGYLTGFIIASVYHFYRGLENNTLKGVFWGSLFAALAIMTKGMFALIPIAGAIGGGLMIGKRWEKLFSIRWLVAALLILIFILPEIYCLYYQFDLHPEKVVFGRQNVSGVRFFFWDSQFGRFFNTGPIKGSGNVFFFLHTTLWAFLPWSIILYIALAGRIKKVFFGYTAEQEWFAFSGAILTFLLFSFSGFQLPHYMNVVFPFFAVITAGYIFREKNAVPGYLLISQYILLAVMAISIAFIYVLYAPAVNWLLPVMLIFFIAGLMLPAIITKQVKERFLLRTVLTAVLVNVFLNLYFYPALLTYQSGSEAAFYANEHYPGLPVVQVNGYYSPLEFYARQPVLTRDSLLRRMPRGPYLVYLAAADLPAFRSGNLRYSLVKKMDEFRISRLNYTFLNKVTRKKAVLEYQLLLVQ